MPQIYRDGEAIHQIVSRFSKKWQAQADKAIARLYAELKSGRKLIEAEAIIEQEFPGLFRLDGIHDAITEAAAYGYGIMPQILTDAQKGALVKELNRPWTGDNMPLSVRLHGAQKEMRTAITTVLSAQIRRGNTWIEAARALYDGYGHGRVIREQDLPKYLEAVRRAAPGSQEALAASRRALYNINRLAKNGAPNRSLKAAYNQLLEAAKKGSDKALEKAAWVAIQEKSRYVAERITRTESARAWADGFFAATLDDKDIIAYKWKLASRHPIYDICDFYAGADFFNLGPGVYPKNKVPPLPAHPHCLCHLTEVFVGEADMGAMKDNTRAAGDSWLKKVYNDERVKLLGVKGNDAWLKGGDWRDYMRGWQGLGSPQSRLSAKTFGFTQQGKGGIIKKGDLEKHFGKSHTDKMTEILEKSPENVQMLWNKYADDLSVVTTQSRRGDFCNSKGISINLDEASREKMYKGQLAKKPYYTVYHEFGHNIDHIVRHRRGDYRSIADTFESAVYKNAKGTGYTLTDMLKLEGTERISNVLDHLKQAAKATGGKASDVRKLKAYDELTAELRAKPVLSMTDVSDMWDGITGEAIRPHFGHGKTYWKTHTVGTEAFAEMFSATVMNPESVEQIKYYFPKSYKIFEEILENIGGGK